MKAGKKKLQKGEKGYLAWNQKMSALKTLILFLMPLAVFAMGWWSTGKRENLLTIVAILGCLPACRSAANLVALLRCKEISEEDYRKILPHVNGCTAFTELAFTSYEKTWQIRHMAFAGNDLIGYTDQEKCDPKACEKHLHQLFSQNQMGGVNIRIFTDLPRYVNRLDEIQKKETEKDSDLSAQVSSLLTAVSL